MRITLITGGVRSGKSRFALDRALEAGGENVTFVATARVTDEEMQRRVAQHRADRPRAWRSVETPRDVARAILGATTPVVLLDCLTFLVANAMLGAEASGEQAALSAAAQEIDNLLEGAAARDGDLIVVTNEVGWGVVPAYPLGRWFRDAAGTANQRVGRSASEVYLLVAGLPLRIKP